jgi:hypothetical protein
MTGADGVVISSYQELVPGDAIEAFFRSTLVHRGPVTGTAPDHGLFWILDTLTGSRRLLDMSELEIVRLPAHHREVRVNAPGR